MNMLFQLCTSSSLLRITALKRGLIWSDFSRKQLGIRSLWSQPPIWPPMILASWYVSSYVISSRTVPGLSVLTIEYGRSDDICFLRWVYENTVALMCLINHSLSDHLLWEEPVSMWWAALWRGPCGKELSPPASSQEGTEASCQEP